MPDIKEKLVELINDVLKYLPWGEVSKHTAKDVANYLMDNGVTIQEWISVEDRLPEYGEKVLACDTREDYVGIAVLQKGTHLWWSNPESYWSWGEMELALDEFTHWMPMPEPPKGE